MLAIKTLGAKSRSSGLEAGPGLVFDEVDAGISGRVADVVGWKLKELGQTFQVLCITHLPQVAAHADVHFHIAKTVDAGRTRTTLRRLDESARVEELARLLSGADLTPHVLDTAREMLMSRRAASQQVKGESKPKGESERAKAKPRPARS
jgi:DNA repair protein RecN (Recombination protein N)